jgi:hypothetical protein
MKMYKFGCDIRMVAKDGVIFLWHFSKVSINDLFSLFLIKKLIFWIVGVVGGYEKKDPTRKAHIRRELVLLLWAKKIAQTPNYGFVGKITARPSSLTLSCLGG